jgi:hypothetical protein
MGNPVLRKTVPVPRPPVRYGANGLPEYNTVFKNTSQYIASSETHAPYRPRPQEAEVSVRLVIWGLFLGGIVWMAFNFFWYVDPAHGCFITIRPSFTTFGNPGIVKALKVMKQSSPQLYDRVCSRISGINPNFSCGGVNGGCYSSVDNSNRGDQYKKVDSGKQTIDISTDPNNISGAIMIIAHETCHAYQHLENRAFSEPECYEAGYSALANIVDY